jgi:hypothetical protein
MVGLILLEECERQRGQDRLERSKSIRQAKKTLFRVAISRKTGMLLMAGRKTGGSLNVG